MVRKRAPCILAYAGLAGVGDEVGVVGRENGIASVESGKHQRLRAGGLQNARMALRLTDSAKPLRDESNLSIVSHVLIHQSDSSGGPIPFSMGYKLPCS